MQITLDTSKMSIIIDGKAYVITDKSNNEPTPAPEGKTMADFFEADEGAKEWDATVAKIQTWYYGYVSKTAWCATSLSYYANMAGVADQTGKYNNVDRVKDFMNSRGMLDCTKNYGGGHYVPKRGDVVFMSDKKTYADCTHIGVISDINTSKGTVTVISGNCADSICKRTYNYLTDKYVVAWGRIVY